jgi:hypothetical protein
MRPFIVTIGGILLLVNGLAAAQVYPAPTVPPASAPATQMPGQNPAAVQAPAENLPPPTPAQVTFRNGLLTVHAANSTLSGLLTAIRNKTGIQFEGLENGNPERERIVVAMGPAPEGDVLATILGGSQFYYVVVDRPDSPGIVQRVILSPRGGASPIAGSLAGAQPHIPTRAELEGDEEASDDQSPDPNQVQAQPLPMRPPLTQAQPLQNGQMQNNQNNQTQNPPQVKTPQQFLEELRQMKERQQQLQRQQQPN